MTTGNSCWTLHFVVRENKTSRLRVGKTDREWGGFMEQESNEGMI